MKTTESLLRRSVGELSLSSAISRVNAFTRLFLWYLGRFLLAAYATDRYVRRRGDRK